MGRKSFLERYNLTYQDLRELHQDCIHIDQLARDLEVTKRTLKKHLLDAGLKRDEIKYKPRKKYRKHSKLAEWRRQHPDVKLPPSVPEIQKLTGLSRFTIHHYLYRRQEEFYEYVKANWISFLKAHRRGKVLEFNGKKIPILALSKELLTINKFSLTLMITFLLKNGARKKVSIAKSYFEEIIRGKENV